MFSCVITSTRQRHVLRSWQHLIREQVNIPAIPVKFDAIYRVSCSLPTHQFREPPEYHYRCPSCLWLLCLHFESWYTCRWFDAMILERFRHTISKATDANLGSQNDVPVLLHGPLEAPRSHVGRREPCQFVSNATIGIVQNVTMLVNYHTDRRSATQFRIYQLLSSLNSLNFFSSFQRGVRPI